MERIFLFAIILLILWNNKIFVSLVAVFFHKKNVLANYDALFSRIS